MRLDIKEKFPSGMEQYLSYYGWHFSKNMCEWAVSNMYKLENGKEKEITPYNKGMVDKLLRTYAVSVKNNKHTYDVVYVANMGVADFLGSSILNDQHLAKYIKDVMDDPDGYEGMVFTRFYADCIGKGTEIHWEDML